MSLNSRDFRNALGQFTTGVCVATAAAPQGPIGLTINSFASVSLEPRLILWSLDRQSDTFAIFASASHFGIDILGANARDLSARLSRKGKHELHDHELAPRASTPHLKGALAWFSCAVEARHNGGDHEIFVGRVLEFGYEPGGDPLVYYRGRYRALHELTD